MNIQSDKPKIIFRKEKGDKTFYSIALSKKDIKGDYINGYMMCRFPKDTSLPNKTKIIMRDAWLDFYIKDNITCPYIFINKYEIIEDGKMVYKKQDVPQNIDSDYEDNGIVLTDADLPF